MKENLTFFTQCIISRNENEIRELVARKKQIEKDIRELKQQNRELKGKA